jgi:hydrogenase expression/formation protein HypE
VIDVLEHRLDPATFPATKRSWASMRAHPLGRQAARIGRVISEHPGFVRLVTPIGGERILDLPFGKPLPRIC